MLRGCFKSPQQESGAEIIDRAEPQSVPVQHPLRLRVSARDHVPWRTLLASELNWIVAHETHETHEKEEEISRKERKVRQDFFEFSYVQGFLP